MLEPGPPALPFAVDRGHPRGMRARRRAGPAAIAAALLGLGLAFYRPPGVPELRVGSRVMPPPPAATLAGTIAWPQAPGLSAGAGSSVPGPVGPSPVEGEVWRDALANNHLLAGEHAAPASRAASVDAGLNRIFNRRSSSAESASTKISGAKRVRINSPHHDLASGSTGRSHPARPAPQKTLRRVPLAQGPAASNDEGDPVETGKPTVAHRPVGGRPNAAAWTRRTSRAFPLFQPPHRARARAAKATRRRRVKPLLLSKLLGRGALRPPPASLVAPNLSRLNARRPLRMPNGTPVPTRAYDLDLLEAQDPRLAGSTTDSRRSDHWDAGPLWHAGSARGLIADARWLWLWKDKTRWWAVREPQESPLFRHKGLWWSKQRRVWFALHDGELWSWRRFAEWDAEGLIRLTDGVELVYSADFTKVAVITPGEGAVLYDAYTGAELGHWRESELPRRRPRAPAELRLPHGI